MDAKTLIKAVRQERRGNVMLLIMGLRPVNALTPDLRAGLMQGLGEAMADPLVQAVVICSDIAVFSAGADASEHGRPSPPALAELCLQIERSDKPVIMAINGKAIGAGLELALAAHLRIAEAGAQMGLPEVSLGVVPGAGGTQRLARLVGAGPALRLLLEPAPISAEQGLSIGLVDQVVAANLRDAAVDLAATTALRLGPRDLPRASERRDGLRDGKAYHSAVIAARAKLAGSILPAPPRAVDCVEAAQLLTPEQGLAYEEAAHSELAASPEAQALRHIFLAERRAVFPPKPIAAQRVDALRAIALWGANEAMADIAVQALAAGLRVSVIEASREDLSACLSRVALRQEQAVAEGRQTVEARDADWARLGSSSAPEVLAEADLVLANPEAGPVPLNAAAAVLLGALPARTALAKVALIPAMAAGLVAEVSTGPEAPAALCAKVLAFGRMLGWRVVFTGAGGPIDKRLRAALSAAIAEMEAKGVARSVIAASLGSFGIGVGAKAQLPPAPPEAPGVLRACLGALANQGARLLAEGVARRPSDIDAVAVLAGIFPRWQGGPMLQADRVGLLVLRNDLRKMAQQAPQIYEPNALIDQLIAEGRDFAALNRAD